MLAALAVSHGQAFDGRRRTHRRSYVGPQGHVTQSRAANLVQADCCTYRLDQSSEDQRKKGPSGFSLPGVKPRNVPDVFWFSQKLAFISHLSANLALASFLDLLLVIPLR